jgi:hypothetical protein
MNTEPIQVEDLMRRVLPKAEEVRRSFKMTDSFLAKVEGKFSHFISNNKKPFAYVHPYPSTC